MAKVIKYILCTKISRGETENPENAEIFSPVVMGWNEVNEEIAKREAYNGEYTIEDDGQPEPEATAEEQIAELKEALNLLLSGVTE
jgi:hypothetical protein